MIWWVWYLAGFGTCTLIVAVFVLLVIQGSPRDLG